MPNIGAVLREEISRLARKEIRSQTEALRKASADYRKKFADMRRQVGELQRQITSLERQVARNIPSKVGTSETGNFRFSAKGLRSNRKRLGLSASDYGRLIGVTAQTVYKWESEATRPRQQQMAALAALRAMGKKEAQARLAKQPKKRR